MAEGGIIALRVGGHSQSGAVGIESVGGLKLAYVAVNSPLGAAMPVLGGQLAREVSYLVCGFTVSPLRPFRCDCNSHVVESCSVVTIAKLLVLTQHHHVRTKEDFGERWR